MSETKRNKERVDQAWNKLYDRLDADGLLLSDRQNRKRLSASMLWKWGAVAAIWVGIGVFLTTTYRKVGEPVEVRALIMQENSRMDLLSIWVGKPLCNILNISLWTSVRSVCRETLCLMWPVTGNVLF